MTDQKDIQTGIEPDLSGALPDSETRRKAWQTPELSVLGAENAETGTNSNDDGTGFS